MFNKRACFVSMLTLAVSAGSAQQGPFSVYLKPFNIDGLGGLQSYAYGQDSGRWLLLGGRLDGLHRRQPFAAFDVAGNNNQIIVIDPLKKQKWTAPLTSLPVDLQEQLSSTNMQFHQDGKYLYLTGGYGYHAATDKKTTFGFLTAIDVPALVQAVMQGNAITGHFRQIANPEMAVTGGHLKKIYDTYYLVCGNYFDGNYNPMGNPTYTQVYTDAIKKFSIIDDGNMLKIEHLGKYTDAANLHRRDLNVVPQIMPDGTEGITAFSGVFQPGADLPFLNSVDIDSSGYHINDSFKQYYNHYHSAVLPIFEAGKKNMHTVFFGGIAQFYRNAGTRVQDDNVPFVKTIASVTRDAGGKLSEQLLDIEMPALLGASAELIPAIGLPRYRNGVLKLDDLQKDTTLVGYIFGGIQSSAANIFFTNNGTQSQASSSLMEVYVVKKQTTGIVFRSEEAGQTSLRAQILPNPNSGDFTLAVDLPAAAQLALSLHDMQGKVLERKRWKTLSPGTHKLQVNFKNRMAAGSYKLLLSDGNEKVVLNLLLQP
jgi:hypothetical protein